MLFHSPHANLQVICSPTRIKFHPVTGDEVERTPAIWANFGKLGPSYEYTNPETGATDTGAEITGHYYDTDIEAVQNDWNTDTKALVERKLLGLCKREPTRIQMIERDPVAATVPWPTYDEMDAAQVVAFAQQTGLVEATLAYERENRDRPDVFTGLAAEVEEPATGDEDESPLEPVAVKKVADPALRTITV